VTRAVDVESLVKLYGPSREPAVAGISFHVEPGEIFGLIGADGAGKTTTLEILAGVMQPTAGSTRVFGIDPSRKRGQAGYLTQKFSLYQDLSIAENLRYAAGLRQVAESEFQARRQRYLSLFGLEGFDNRLAGRLSGGMKQKLALACSLIANPRLLILDEPTTGVDPVSRRDFWDVLTLLASEGITVVAATPYLDEAERCHRVALMERGRIVDEGTPAALRASLGCVRLLVHVPDLAAAEEALSADPEVADVQRFGDRLDVLVRDAAAGQALVRNRFGITAAERAPTLENAFVASLRRLRGPAAAPAFPERSPRHSHAGPLLEARRLHKTFGTFQAVRDFSLTLAPGDVYGLLGANGAGKTTAIKMMCGLLGPTRGDVALLGRKHGLRDAALRARIGYMSQKFTLYDDLTIGENLDFYAHLYGVPARLRQARKDWVLTLSGLEGEAGLLTARLPGGWKQRVAFGAAVMHEPELIFLDEPTSGVDPLARRAMWRMINELAASGAAILVVTHYLEEAEQCSRIGFMAAGETLLEGSPSEVRRRRTGSLHEIEVADPAKAMEIARNLWGRASVTQFGNRIHAATEASPQDLAAALAPAGVLRIDRGEFSLEDVFIGLMEERRAA
jgi:ABC-2 type transport system ATP-binding protein